MKIFYTNWELLRLTGQQGVVRSLLLIFLFSVLFVSCGISPTGLRSLAHVDTVVYLETPDVGELMRVLQKHASAESGGAIDASMLNGIEVAVAVSGFKASESAVTATESVLNFQPQFTLIAETHAWSWQVAPLVEGTLGKFVTNGYGTGTRLDKSIREGIEWYEWTASDGRKAFAATSGSVVFFGNSEEGVRRSLRVSEGKEGSLLESERLSIQYRNAGGKLAFGFVTKEGVRQLSEFAGISMAIDQSDEAGAQSVISSVFPSMISNTVEEIVWTSTAEGELIEDVIDVRLDPKIAEAFTEAMRPSNAPDDAIFDLVPGDAFSVTRYNLRNPRIAFRSLLLAAATKVDAPAGRYIPLFGASMLEPYGVADPEAFLSYCEPYLLTVQFDEEGEKAAGIVRTKDFESVRKLLIEDLVETASTVEGTRRFSNGELAAVLKDGFLVLGDPDAVDRCLAAKVRDAASQPGKRINGTPIFSTVRRPEHTVATAVRDTSAKDLARTIGGDIENERFGLTLTDFDSSGIKRTYRSSFGFAGFFVRQFAGND